MEVKALITVNSFLIFIVGILAVCIFVLDSKLDRFINQHEDINKVKFLIPNAVSSLLWTYIYVL